MMFQLEQNDQTGNEYGSKNGFQDIIFRYSITEILQLPPLTSKVQQWPEAT